QITTRLLARQNTRLLISEERFRSLVKNSADVNIILAADGSITYESPAVERVLGYPSQTREATLALDHVHPEDREIGAQLLADVVRVAGAQRSAELRFRHADG